VLHPVTVLDTRANAAAAVLRRLEGEARLLEEDTGGPEEMSDLSGGAKSPLQVLKGQIAIARVDAAAARGPPGGLIPPRAAGSRAAAR